MKFFDQLSKGLNDLGEAVVEALDEASKSRRQRALEVARPLGLDVDARGRFVGAIEGVPILRYSQDHGGKDNTDWWTHTEFGLVAPLPSHLTVRRRKLLDQMSELFGATDVQLGHPLDPQLWVRCSKRVEGQAVALLSQSGVVDALGQALQQQLAPQLEGSKVRFSFRGRHLKVGDRGLALGVWMAQALDRTIRAEWDGLAGERTLTRSGDWCVEGHLDRVPVRAEVLVTRPLFTRVTGWLAAPLPAGTEIAHPRQLKGGEALDDPILGKMVAVRTSDRAAVEARVCTDAARAPLLEIVHGQRGSVVLEDRVILDLPGHVGVGIRASVALVVELVRALGN